MRVGVIVVRGLPVWPTKGNRKQVEILLVFVRIPPKNSCSVLIALTKLGAHCCKWKRGEDKGSVLAKSAE